MTLKHKVASLERLHKDRLSGVCHHGLDIVGIDEPERPAPRCERCGLRPRQIVLREDQSGRAWSSRERVSARGEKD